MTNKNDAGKGDTYRRVNKKLYDENYDAIFTTHYVVDCYYSDGMHKGKDSEIVFKGSLKKCQDWLKDNQIRIGSMSGARYIYSKEDFDRIFGQYRLENKNNVLSTDKIYDIFDAFWDQRLNR